MLLVKFESFNEVLKMSNTKMSDYDTLLDALQRIRKTFAEYDGPEKNTLSFWNKQANGMAFIAKFALEAVSKHSSYDLALRDRLAMEYFKQSISSCDEFPELVAEHAYKHADAMMNARKFRPVDPMAQAVL
jgi:hypothetical protein